MPTIMKTLNRISRCQSLFRNERLQHDGILSCHHTFVLVICRNPGSSQDELAREICINKSTVTRTLNYLEEKGYITRRADSEDKRRILVYPTEKMLAVLPEVRAIAREWNELISKDIPEDELSVFYSVLSRMELSAKAAVECRGDEDR